MQEEILLVLGIIFLGGALVAISYDLYGGGESALEVMGYCLVLGGFLLLLTY